MVKKVSRYITMLVSCSILFSVTASSIILFSFSGISISAMRMAGIFCILTVVVQILRKPVISRLQALLLLLSMEMLIVTVFFSPNISKGIPLLLDYFVCIAVIYLIVFSTITKDIYKKYLLFFYLAFLITALICIYEFILGKHIVSNYTYGWSGDAFKHLLKAPTAFLYNPNNVGVLMIMSIPMLFLIPHFFGENKTILMFILLILDFSVILMTGSRGAFLGGVVLLVMSILSSQNKIWIKILFIFIGFSIVFGTQDFIRLQLMYGGMMKNNAISIFGEGDGGRIYLINYTLEHVFRKNWIFGVGAGGIECITGMSVHNFLVEFISDFGVIGMTIFATGIIYVIRDIFFIQDKSIRKNMLLILVSFFMTMFIPPTMMTLHFVWVVLALLISFIKIDKDGEIYSECDDIN